MISQGILHRREMGPLRPPPRVPVNPQFDHFGATNSQRLRRATDVVLLFFCLGVAIGLVHVIGISRQVLIRLEAYQVQPPNLFHQPRSKAREMFVRDDQGANVLIAFSEGPHLTKLAESVMSGIQNILGNQTKSLRVRDVENASFADDVMWADAMVEFLKGWSISEDLSRKIGAVFVTSAGLSAGEELTMVNLLHSLMIFRMIIVGGEHWTSAFGASAIVGEGPFKPVDRNGPEKLDFPPICYPTDPDSIQTMFKDKAIGLGERVASIATQLRRAQVHFMKQN
ncbi:hypothetical protein PsorP6_005825 [Peronosclerospora sorghi]|uniref:Uncharacterized protein n=1 Tax=Peronosclerospora sorghi TaxID=230839 RepID=A0ACC0W1X6_9STRA|nr:hypothetical protein PsorP6_005825 [Peronosclerospora sorghi]